MELNDLSYELPPGWECATYHGNSCHEKDFPGFGRVRLVSRVRGTATVYTFYRIKPRLENPFNPIWPRSAAAEFAEKWIAEYVAKHGADA